MQSILISALAVMAAASPLAERAHPEHNGVAVCTTVPCLSPARLGVLIDKQTYYTQDGNAGSCGQYHSDSDYIVAISEQAPFTYNAHCGQTVTITNTGGGGSNNKGVGRTITATVADTCPECDPNHLDLSTGAFRALAGELQPLGEFNIRWHLN